MLNIANIKSKIYKHRRNYLKVQSDYQIVKSLNKELNKEYSGPLKNYINIETENLPEVSDKVWVMWWQGPDNMPESIKICFNSLLENANGYEVVLITSNNFSEFIELPNYILDKIDRGIISLTHLSDLIRSILLSDYGGLWLDATILVTQPLPSLRTHIYWSPKWELPKKDLRKYRLWYSLWKISRIPPLTITQCMGMWYSRPGNPIFLGLKDFWLAYWQKESEVPYYWMTEVFLMGTLYESCPNIKNLVDDLEPNNPACLDLEVQLNHKFSKSNLDKLQDKTSFFYLRRKSEYEQIDSHTGLFTMYGFLKKKYLKDISE
jgi:hypothetical protein